MADIFVSYSSKDREMVAPLVTHLEEAGYSVWWDRQLQGGTMFSAKIEAEVEKSDIVLVVWSAASLASRWVADETELALQTGKLIPIKIGGVSPPMGFRQIQTIDFAGWDGGARDKTIDALITAIDHQLSGVRTTGKTGARSARNARASNASIAVLPFVNMSSDPEQEYFSDGIAEELLNLLAKIRQMRVVARTSSFAFKGADKQVSEIGELLDVAHVIEGSVRKSGNRVRITAQLIETKTSSHLWSETYDRTLDDIFAVQDEISAAIVDAMKGLILGDIEMPQVERSSSVDAYDHYLLGHQLLAKRTKADIEEARACFEAALKLDPDYAPALIGKADAHLLLSNNPGCYGQMSGPEARALAMPLLERAVELEPESDEACCVLALYHQDHDFEKAIAYCNEALVYNPNCARACMYLSFAYLESGDPNAPGVSTLRRAIELDPVSLVALHNLANTFLERQQYEETAALLRKMKAIDSASAMVQNVEAQVSLEAGKLCETLRLMSTLGDNAQSTSMIYVTLSVLVDMGYTDIAVKSGKMVALQILAERGLTSETNQLRESLTGEAAEDRSYFNVQGFAFCATRNGDYAQTLDLLKPFEEADPDKWGAFFGLDETYLGARLSLHARRKLGKTASASLYLIKLKELYQTFKIDPDGAHFSAPFLGALIATIEGDIPGALDLLEQQLDATISQAAALLGDPNLETLHDEPRYKALCARIAERFAAERKEAEAAVLLPISQDMIDKLTA